MRRWRANLGAPSRAWRAIALRRSGSFARSTRAEASRSGAADSGSRETTTPSTPSARTDQQEAQLPPAFRGLRKGPQQTAAALLTRQAPNGRHDEVHARRPAGLAPRMALGYRANPVEMQAGGDGPHQRPVAGADL